MTVLVYPDAPVYPAVCYYVVGTKTTAFYKRRTRHIKFCVPQSLWLEMRTATGTSYRRALKFEAASCRAVYRTPLWGHAVHCHTAVLYGLIEQKRKGKGGLACDCQCSNGISGVSRFGWSKRLFKLRVQAIYSVISLIKQKNDWP
jgi:hypothetical protein